GVGFGGDLGAEAGAEAEEFGAEPVVFRAEVFDAGELRDDDLFGFGLPPAGFGKLLVEEGERVIGSGDDGEESAVLVAEFGDLVDGAAAAGALGKQVEGH